MKRAKKVPQKDICHTFEILYKHEGKGYQKGSLERNA
jgi:hypothetical protein